MGQPIPGGSFANVVSLQDYIPKHPNRYRLRAAAPNGAPPLSTLQALDPTQLAALGVSVAGGTVAGAGIYNAFSTQPGGTVLVPTAVEDGTYGSAGQELVIRIFRDDGAPVSGDYNGVYGPVTPTIVTFQNPGFPQFNVWEFSGFDSQGAPRTVGGQSSATRYLWQTGQPAKYFEIYDVGNVGIPLQPNTTPGTDIPVEIPPVPVFPPSPAEEAAAEELEELGSDIEELGEAIADVGALAGAIANTLSENLTCNICDLVDNNSVWDEVNQQQLQDDIDELLRRTELQIDVTLDTSDCEETPNPVQILGDTLSEVAQLLEAIGVMQEYAKNVLCEELPKDCACPEEWTLRKNPATPVLVLRLRESSEGHTGTPKPRDISIPSYSGDGLSNFPVWTRGDYRCTVSGDTGLRITVWANTETEARRVVDELADLSTGFSTRRYVTGYQQNIVVNKVELTPWKTFWYPSGRLSGTQPAIICNIEKGICFP